MPTVSTYLKIVDQSSRPIQRISNQVNGAIVSMERMRRLVERPATLNIDASKIQQQLAHIQHITQSARIDITFNAQQAVQRARMLRTLIQNQLNNIQARIRVELPASLNVLFANLQRLMLRLTAATRRIGSSSNNTAQLESALQRIAQLEQKIAQLQDNVNAKTRQAGGATNGWLSNLKGIASAYLSFQGAKSLIGSTMGGAMQQQKMEDMFKARTGDAEVGTAMFDKFKKDALAAGQDVNEALKGTLSFFSTTQNTDHLSELNKIASRMAAFDSAGNGIEGAAFALKEAMSGDIVSLAERFNMSKTDIRAFKIDELGKAGNMDGFIKAFNQLLEKQKMGEEAFTRMMESPAKQAEVLGNNVKSAMADAGGAAVVALMPLITMLNNAFKAGEFQPFFDGLSNGLAIVTDGLVWLVENAMWLSGVIVDNWPTIEPVIWGIVGALAAWKFATTAINIVLAIHNGLQTFMAAKAAIATKATFAQTAAQYGLNTALLANPMTWVVIGIIALIAAIVLLVKYIINLWKTNDEFAAGLMRAWNSVLNFFDQIPIFFARVGSGIVDAFYEAKVSSLKIMELLVNGVIDGVNWLIEKLKKIPGVTLDTIGQVEFTSKAAAEAAAIKQAGEEAIKKMEDNAVDKAAEREQKVLDMLEDRAKSRAEKEKELAEEQKKEKEKEKKGNGEEILAAWNSKVGAPNSLNSLGDIDKVKEVGKIKDTVDISSEDIKTMRELAEMKNIQNFVSLTPSISFGDTHIRKDGDINTIIARITDQLNQDIASSANAAYG